jgi:hypothetical protein
MGDKNQLLTCKSLILLEKQKSQFRFASLESKKSAWKRALSGSRPAAWGAPSAAP